MATPASVRAFEYYLTVYKRTWRGTAIGSFLNPLFYLTRAVAASVGIYLLVAQRSRQMAKRPSEIELYESKLSALYYFLGASVPGAALATYNTYFLGSPFRFGQSEAGHALALEKTGLPGVWQTPLWDGAAGLLLSPSRGLFFFSPFLLLAAIR